MDCRESDGNPEIKDLPVRLKRKTWIYRLDQMALPPKYKYKVFVVFRLAEIYVLAHIRVTYKPVM